MTKGLFLTLGSAGLLLQGCVAGMALSAAGDVVEGTANATVFTVKTTGKAAGKAAGAVVPGGEEEEDRENRDE